MVRIKISRDSPPEAAAPRPVPWNDEDDYIKYLHGVIRQQKTAIRRHKRRSLVRKQVIRDLVAELDKAEVNQVRCPPLV